LFEGNTAVWKILVGLLLSLSAHGAERIESSSITDLFDRAGVSGTFVLYDQRHERYIFHNQDRINERFIPASTFKIPNALIGLSLGVVESVDEILSYGGSPQRVKTWENDMGLKDAMKVSNLPVFQNLARRIGIVRMRGMIEELSYGNTKIGEEVDMFWLTGPLKISAVEQVEFLSELAESKLSFPITVQRSVKDILLQASSGDCRLYAKTGWLGNAEPNIGWWVGWVDNNGHVTSFALNMDIRVSADAKKRKRLGKQVLSELGLWPCG